MHYFSMIDLLSHLSIRTKHEHLTEERVVPKGKVERLIPKRFQTVANMIKECVKVRAHCSKCDLNLKVDFELLQSHHGPAFSLIGKRGKCRRLGCEGSTVFLAEGHGRYEPL
jgi:hypothetical protein